MIKFLLYVFVIIVVFSTALYLGIFNGIITQLGVIKSDFLPYIPTEIRLIGFFIILGLGIGLVYAFSKN